MAKPLFTLYLNRSAEVLQLPDGSRLQLGVDGSKRQKQKKSWVWVATEAVICSKVDLPAAGSVTELVAYALEESLIEPIENYHIVIAERKAKVAASMALTHKQMQNWCEALRLSGFSPVGIFPDFLALPWRANSCSIYINQNRLLIRTGKFSGLASSLTMLSTLLASEQIEPEQTRLLLESGCQAPAELAECAQVEEVDFWQLLSAQKAPDKKANFYQGAYAKAQSSNRFSLRPLWPVVAYSLLVALLWLGQNMQQDLNIQLQTQELAERNQQLLKQMLPAANIRNSDWRDQALKTVSSMRAQGQSAYGEDAFWQAMDKMSKLMRRCDPCLIQQINYEDDELKITFSSYVHNDSNLKPEAEELFTDQELSWITSRSRINGVELFQSNVSIKL